MFNAQKVVNVKKQTNIEINLNMKLNLRHDKIDIVNEQRFLQQTTKWVAFWCCNKDSVRRRDDKIKETILVIAIDYNYSYSLQPI